MGKPKWNREAINKLISNEKYTGRVLLQKTISAGSSQFKNDGLLPRYPYWNSHEAIISDEMFKAAQQEKIRRTNCPETSIHANAFLILAYSSRLFSPDFACQFKTFFRGNDRNDLIDHSRGSNRSLYNADEFRLCGQGGAGNSGKDQGHAGMG